MARAILAALLVAATLGLVPAASASRPPTGDEPKAQAPRSAAPAGCPYARAALAFYRGRYAHHQLERGAAIPTWRKPTNCADARYLASVWTERARAARVTTAHWKEQQRRERMNNPTTAICTVFGSYCAQALRVASCESGRGVNAANGQYLGMFQMGSYARAAYGHGPDALTQARAAYRYFVASGRDWSPWSCKPW